MFQREHEGARHILHMHEVAPLLPILEDHRGLPVLQPRGENCQHARIGVGKGLAGAIDIPEAQCHALHPIGRGKGEGKALLHELGDGIDRGEARTLPFRRGNWHQRTTPRVERVPWRVHPGSGLPHGILYEPTFRIAVQAFAIDAHRGCNDDAAHRILDQLLEQHGGALIVHGHIAIHRVHALPDAYLGREVHDPVHALDGIPHGIGITHVADENLRIRIQAVCTAVAMHLLDEAVQDADMIAPAEEFPRDVASDKACTAGDQDRFCQSAISDHALPRTTTIGWGVE